MVGKAVIAVPGDLATPTGGYGYTRRIIAELVALGWEIDAVDLGDGFPCPTAHMRAAASARLCALSSHYPIVVDGLAFGVLPETAEALRQSHRLIALVHHPLALETGLSADASARLHASEEAALACARHVIVSSATTKRILAADFHVPPECSTVIEPGTDRPLFTCPRRGELSQAAIPRKALTSREGDVGLLSVGSVVPRKGYDVLVAALAKIRHLSWRLVIAGDCSRSVETFLGLRAQIRLHGLDERIHFYGVATTEELTSLYTCSDVFVLPSRFEGYGMAFAEAIAHGVPVVGTLAGALAETVPAGTGILVPPDDAEALANALAWLIEQPQERQNLAVGARAAKFPSWREQGARFASVLEAVA